MDIEKMTEEFLKSGGKIEPLDPLVMMKFDIRSKWVSNKPFSLNKSYQRPRLGNLSYKDAHGW